MPHHKREAGVYVAPHLVEDVHREVAKHRKASGYQEGMVWNPRTPPAGAYEWPPEGGSDAPPHS